MLRGGCGGGSEPCLKELTFDVLIMPAGCRTVVQGVENEVAGGVAGGAGLQIHHLARFCIWTELEDAGEGLLW